MAENLTYCPVCKNTGFSPFLNLQDHFLTREHFTIVQCNGCGFRFINPRPGKEEIGRYYQSDEYISHDAEKKDLISRIYKIARVFSINRKFRIVADYCKDGRILDIGCGTGEFLAYCRDKGYDVLGVEPNEKARTYAQDRNKIAVAGSPDVYLDRAGTFRCITLWHVLEHVHDLDETLNTIKKLLSADGVLIIAVPNSNSWDAEKYERFWAAFDVPRHLYHFTRETMFELAAKMGFDVLKTVPQKLDAYYVSMLSEKYLHGKTNYINFVLNGFRSNLKAKKNNRGHSSLIFILAAKKT